MDIWQTLMTPFSWLLKQFIILFDSYGLALLLFTLVVKVILFPFSYKSKKSMIKMNLISAQQKEIQKRYPNDRNKQQEELQRLYNESGVNPMGGCLWSLLPMFVLFPLYAVIRRPFKYLMGLTDAATVAVAGALGWADFSVAGMSELSLAAMLNSGNLSAAEAAARTVAEKANLFLINFNFFGIDLSQIPNWKFWANGITWGAVGLALLPLISAGLSLVSSLVMQKTNAMNKQQEASAAAQNRSMMIMMPLMSLWIGFTLPAGLCIYWIANSLFSMLQEVIAGLMLRKDYEQAQIEMEKQLAASKAAEKERRRAAAERKAAALAEKKPAKKKSAEKKDTGSAVNKDDSRVGMRTYARGRAYDPNRYPVTPYHDPNAAPIPDEIPGKVTEEEPAELTAEEKELLADRPELLEAVAAAEAAVEETGDYEAPYAEDSEESDDNENKE